MKRALLAVFLLLPLTLARINAQETAYVSLVGMADSASTDRGPQAGELPQDEAARMEGRSAPEYQAGPETASADGVAARTQGAPARAPGPKPAKREAEKAGDAPMVAVPQRTAPRIWTKFFSSLLPAASAVPSFEVAVSTVPRVRPRASSPATSASAAGSAQGFLELVATTTAP